MAGTKIVLVDSISTVSSVASLVASLAVFSVLFWAASVVSAFVAGFGVVWTLEDFLVEPVDFWDEAGGVVVTVCSLTIS